MTDQSNQSSDASQHSAIVFLKGTSKLAKFKRASRVYYFVCEVMNTIFHYDLLLISLNDKIIRYMSQAKNEMFLFYFNYLEKFYKYLSFKIQI